MHTPRYRCHKPSGKAFVECKKLYGDKRHYFPGLHGSPESLAAYEEFKSKLLTVSFQPPKLLQPGQRTVAAIALEYHRFCCDHYPATSTEPDGIACALRPVVDNYGLVQAAAFGPLALQAVRERLVYNRLSRKYINRQVDRIRGMFKWAASRELVPVAVHAALMTVAPLKAGRTAAKELPPVRAVPWSAVEVLLPHLPGVIAAGVRVLWFTGCRLGEMVPLRPCDLEQSGDVWLYHPGRHKNAHRGQVRVICFGPQAMAALKPYLTGSAKGYIFTPATAWRETCERRKATRKTKAYGKAAKLIPKPRRFLPRYNARSFAHALRHGWIALARSKGVEGTPAKGQPLADWLTANGITGYWHAHQLRHSRGTMIRANPEWGLEGAQAVLGHATVAASQIYAETSLAVAIAISKSTG